MKVLKIEKLREHFKKITLLSIIEPWKTPGPFLICLYNALLNQTDKSKIQKHDNSA